MTALPRNTRTHRIASSIKPWLILLAILFATYLALAAEIRIMAPAQAALFDAVPERMDSWRDCTPSAPVDSRPFYD